MRRFRLDDRTAGVALLLGYALVLAILYQDPSTGIERATRELPATGYFVILPVAGIATGGYALLELPYRSVLVFFAASYLGVVGIALALGGVVSATTAVAGAGVFALATVAVVTAVRSFIEFLGLDLAV
jgi:hypothetical protein